MGETGIPVALQSRFATRYRLAEQRLDDMTRLGQAAIIRCRAVLDDPSLDAAVRRIAGRMLAELLSHRSGGLPARSRGKGFPLGVDWPDIRRQLYEACLQPVAEPPTARLPDPADGNQPVRKGGPQPKPVVVPDDYERPYRTVRAFMEGELPLKPPGRARTIAKCMKDYPEAFRGIDRREFKKWYDSFMRKTSPSRRGGRP